MGAREMNTIGRLDQIMRPWQPALAIRCLRASTELRREIALISLGLREFGEISGYVPDRPFLKDIEVRVEQFGVILATVPSNVLGVKRFCLGQNEFHGATFHEIARQIVHQAAYEVSPGFEGTRHFTGASARSSELAYLLTPLGAEQLVFRALTGLICPDSRRPGLRSRQHATKFALRIRDRARQNAPAVNPSTATPVCISDAQGSVDRERLKLIDPNDEFSGQFQGKKRQAIARHLHRHLGKKLAMSEFPADCFRDENLITVEGRLSAFKNLRSAINRLKPCQHHLQIFQHDSVVCLTRLRTETQEAETK
jgi:hypothetical protein